jgi:Na+/melibiose symporter-like transporter
VLLIPLAEPGSAIVLWSFTISYGIAFGAAPTLLRTMMADLTDMDELESGEKRAGLFFAMLTTTNKLGAAVAVGLSFGILEVVFSFQPGAENAPEALWGLLLTYTIGTAAGLFLAALPIIGYPLNREAHDGIRQALATKKSATASL